MTFKENAWLTQTRAEREPASKLSQCEEKSNRLPLTSGETVMSPLVRRRHLCQLPSRSQRPSTWKRQATYGRFHTHGLWPQLATWLGPRGAWESFLAAVRDTPTGPGNVLCLAPAGDFLDLTGRAGSIVHKDALAGGKISLGRLAFENLRLGRPDR